MKLQPLISPLPPVKCGSCLAAAFRLCGVLACTVCDWTEPRIRPARLIDVDFAPIPSGTKCSNDRARRMLAWLESHPWSTTVAVAEALGGTAELARVVLIRAGCQRRATVRGGPFEYALPEPAAEEAVAC